MTSPTTSTTPPCTLCILGTGLMGAGLAEAAARRGDTVHVWNRTLEKAKRLEAFGAKAFPSAAEAVRGVDRVHVILNDDAAVDGVLATLGDALGNAVVIDHTTTSPAGTVARAEALSAKGVPFLHAPVFMSPQMCRDGGGLMMAAGPLAVFTSVADALRGMTGRLEYLGERPDAAAAFKLFGNAMIVTIIAGLADVFTMAKALGVEAPKAVELFAFFNPTGTLQGRGKLMAAGDYRASFELAMARKDVRLMLEAAGAETLHVLPGIAERMDALLARGHAEDDVGILAVDAVARNGARPAS